jgi:hypothetical protein
MTRAGKTVAACLLATLAAGCGAAHKPPAEKSSDQAQVTTVLHSYLHAQAQGDGTTACGLLTPAAQNQLIGLVVSAGKGLITSRPSCSDAVGLAHAVAGAQLLSALESARVEQIHINGTSATAQVVDGTTFKPQRVTLEKTGGSWRIAGVPGLGAGST